MKAMKTSLSSMLFSERAPMRTATAAPNTPVDEMAGEALESFAPAARAGPRAESLQENDPEEHERDEPDETPRREDLKIYVVRVRRGLDVPLADELFRLGREVAHPDAEQGMALDQLPRDVPKNETRGDVDVGGTVERARYRNDLAPHARVAGGEPDHDREKNGGGDEGTPLAEQHGRRGETARERDPRPPREREKETERPGRRDRPRGSLETRETSPVKEHGEVHRDELIEDPREGHDEERPRRARLRRHVDKEEVDPALVLRHRDKTRERRRSEEDPERLAAEPPRRRHRTRRRK